MYINSIGTFIRAPIILRSAFLSAGWNLTVRDRMAAGTPEDTPTDYLVQASDVTVRFGPVVALDGFSTRVPPGITGLLGPNGAGKSTFIKTVLGLVEPESGAILVDGLDPRREMTLVRDRVGYMPEHDCTSRR